MEMLSGKQEEATAATREVQKQTMLLKHLKTSTMKVEKELKAVRVRVRGSGGVQYETAQTLATVRTRIRTSYSTSLTTHATVPINWVVCGSLAIWYFHS